MASPPDGVRSGPGHTTRTLPAAWPCCTTAIASAARSTGSTCDRWGVNAPSAMARATAAKTSRVRRRVTPDPPRALAPVALPQPGHVWTGGHDGPGGLAAERHREGDGDGALAEPGVGLDVGRVDAGGADADQHLPGTGLGPFDREGPQHLGAAVAGVADDLHADHGGGRRGTRTPDNFLVREGLYQLSYAPGAPAIVSGRDRAAQPSAAAGTMSSPATSASPPYPIVASSTPASRAAAAPP